MSWYFSGIVAMVLSWWKVIKITPSGHAMLSTPYHSTLVRDLAQRLFRVKIELGYGPHSVAPRTIGNANRFSRERGGAGLVRIIGPDGSAARRVRFAVWRELALFEHYARGC